MQSLPEDEFYRQASLSQLLTGPDEQELSSFRPDIKDPLELVEATPELAGMLGSSLEFVDTRWDSLEASPPPTPSPSPPPSPRPPRHIPPSTPQGQGGPGAGAKMDTAMPNRKTTLGQFQRLENLECSTPRIETKMDTSIWEPPQLGSTNSGAPIPAKTNISVNANVLEPQRQTKSIGITNSANPDSKTDSNMWQPQNQPSMNIENVKSPNTDSRTDSSSLEQQRQQSKTSETPKPANSDSKVDSSTWGQKHVGKDAGISNSANPETKIELCVWQKQEPANPTRNTPAKSDVADGVSLWEPQRLRSRNTVNSDTKGEAAQSEPQRMRNRNSSNPASLNGTADANTLKRQNQGSKTGGDSKSPNASGDGRVSESQRLRSKSSGLAYPAKPNPTGDASKSERPGIKKPGGAATTPKRESSFCDPSQVAKTIKMDAAWPRNLGNVRVHIRDLGMKFGGGSIQRDVKKEQAKTTVKVTRAKTRT